MKCISSLILILVVGLAGFGRAADPGSSARSPVLVELFTSEGCSSCPPADEILRKLDAMQPQPGAELIVLSEHVDYWDHDGWRDQYSFGWVTQRQDAYCRTLRAGDPYTPQMVVNGMAVVNLSDARQMKQIFENAAAAPKTAVALRSVSIDGDTIHGHIQTDGAPVKGGASVYVAIALDHAETQVVAGENRGRHLVHTAVAEYLKKLGKLENGAGFDKDFEVRMKAGLDPRNLRVVAFVQQSDEGKVLGAALEKPPIPVAKPN